MRSEVAAIGTAAQVAGFALAGAHAFPVDTAEQARAAWQALADVVAVVLLGPEAAAALAAERAASPDRLTVVIPS